MLTVKRENDKKNNCYGKKRDPDLNYSVHCVDFSKAFDTVDRATWWKVRKVCGCPDKFTDIVRDFHDNMSAVVSVMAVPVLLFPPSQAGV